MEISRILVWMKGLRHKNLNMLLLKQMQGVYEMARIVILSTLIMVVGCSGSDWDIEKDDGFKISDYEVDDVKLSCENGRRGYRQTYYVGCDVGFEVVHPKRYVIKGGVVSYSHMHANPDSLADIHKEAFSKMGADFSIYKQGMSREGLERDALFVTKLEPLFVLDMWEGGGKMVSSHVVANFRISVSSKKCHLFLVGKESFYYCFDFGAK